MSQETPNIESENNIETQIRPVECLVILGRGIEKVNVEGKEVWKPTRYIQRLNSKGFRTGSREPALGANDATETEKVFVAGGTANVLAGIEFYEMFKEKGQEPKLVIFAAGRPAYLDEEPAGFNEGEPMKEIFDRRIGNEDHETIIQGDDKNTKDDVVNSLKNALEKGMETVAIINTEIAMPRTQEFYKLALQENPEFSQLKVYFIESERLLKERYKDNPVALSEFEKIQNELKSSEAWKYTKEREDGGIQAIRDGKYKGKGKY